LADCLPAPNLVEDRRLLVLSLLGDDERDRTADRFRGGIAEQALRAPVPAQNNAIEILGKYGVVRRLDDRRIMQSLSDSWSALLLEFAPAATPLCPSKRGKGVSFDIAHATGIRREMRRWRHADGVRTAKKWSLRADRGAAVGGRPSSSSKI